MMSNHTPKKQLETTRDQLLARLSLAHQNIKRSKRSSLIDNGQSFIQQTNEERLHSIIIQHAKSRLVRVLRNAIRAALHRRLQRSLYKLKSHAMVHAMVQAKQGKQASQAFRHRMQCKRRLKLQQQTFHQWHSTVQSIHHRSHCNILQDTLDESETVLKRLKAEKLYFLIQQEKMFKKQEILVEQCATMENAVAKVHSQIVAKDLDTAKTMTLRRVFVRHALIRKFYLQQKWALNRWYTFDQNTREATTRQRTRKNRTTQLLVQWKSRRIRNAFKHWKRRKRYVEQKRKAIHSLYRRTMLNQRHSSFDTWKEKVIGCQKYKQLQHKRQCWIKLTTFQTWYDRIEQQKRIASSYIALFKKTRGNRKQRRFGCWYDFVQRSKKQQRIVHNYILKILKRHVRKGLGGGSVVTLVIVSHFVVAFLFLSKLHQCLKHWKMYVLAQQTDAKIRMTEINSGLLLLSAFQHRVLQKTMRKHLLRWMATSVHIKQIALDETVKNKKIQAFLARWLLLLESHMFKRWAIYATESIVNKVKVHRFVQSWKNKHVRSMFNNWKGNVDETLRKKSIMMKFVCQWKNRALSSVVQKWCSKTKDRKRFRTILTRVCVIRQMSWVPYALRRSLSLWKSKVLTFNKFVLQQEEQRKRYKVRATVVWRLLVRQKNQLYRHVLVHWCNVHRHQLQAERKTQQFLHHWSFRHLRGVFDCWYDHVHVCKTNQLKLSQMVQHMKHRRLSLSWTQWNTKREDRRHCRTVWHRLNTWMEKYILSRW